MTRLAFDPNEDQRLVICKLTGNSADTFYKKRLVFYPKKPVNDQYHGIRQRYGWTDPDKDIVSYKVFIRAIMNSHHCQVYIMSDSYITRHTKLLNLARHSTGKRQRRYYAKANRIMRQHENQL
jgi:hypothetical protein